LLKAHSFTSQRFLLDLYRKYNRWLQWKKNLNNHTNEKQGNKYEFSAKPWQYGGPGSWYFISLPKKLAKEIRNALKSEEEGWGRLKASAKIGNSEWRTAIWFDIKMNTYLLPLKAEIRKMENVEINKDVEAVLWI